MSAGPAGVVIAVPARDEENRIVGCLQAILRAVRRARQTGAVDDVVVAVAAHCCRDATAQLAQDVLDATHDVTAVVWEFSEPAPVGAVRSELIDRALEQARGPEARRWLFSTDADTIVPESWVSRGLRLADAARAVMVVGLVDLDERETTAGVREAHDELIRTGIFADGSHDHVYAANLAIATGPYQAVGGFTPVLHGEERALLDAVRAAGHPVLTTSRWRVVTSGRLRARASGGLGDVLNRLSRRIDDDLSQPA